MLRTGIIVIICERKQDRDFRPAILTLMKNTTPRTGLPIMTASQDIKLGKVFLSSPGPYSSSIAWAIQVDTQSALHFDDSWPG